MCAADVRCCPNQVVYSQGMGQSGLQCWKIELYTLFDMSHRQWSAVQFQNWERNNGERKCNKDTQSVECKTKNSSSQAAAAAAGAQSPPLHHAVTLKGIDRNAACWPRYLRREILTAKAIFCGCVREQVCV